MKRVIIGLVCVLAAQAQAQFGALAAGQMGEAKGDVIDGLVAWWKLDGNANDSIGGYNGTITDATNAVGQVGGAYGFNGSSAIISCGSMTNNLDGSFTFAAWCLPATVVYDVRQVMVSERTAALYRACLGIFQGRYSFGQYDGNVNSFVVSTALFEIGVWKHICGVRNTATGKITLYVNGVFDIDAVDASGSPGAYSALYIGGQINQANRYWDGLIDDVRIYNRALSSNEVSTIYNRYK